MDALHDGLHTNPFDQKQYGCTLTWNNHGHPKSVYLPSLGYADDTTTLTNSLVNLSIQHKWVEYFLSFNHMRINPSKCELVGRMKDGSSVTLAEIQLHHISVEGTYVVPRPHDKPIRYLGLHIRFDGEWKDQFTKSYQMISLFARIINKFSLPLSQAAYIYNTFLLPKLELALHYVHGAGVKKWLKECDGLLVGAIKHAIQTPLMLSHTAVAMILGFRLPSWIEVGVKVSELFLRINSKDDRWGRIGRFSLRHECSTIIDTSTVSNRWSQPTIAESTRVKRSTYLATHKLQWKLHHYEFSGRRRQHLFDGIPIAAYMPPLLAECSSTALVSLTNCQTSAAHDVWSGWGASYPNHQVSLYTDGSYHASTDTSAWSVVVQNQWLEEDSDNVPTNEKLINSSHLSQSLLIGASISSSCTSGIYPAELQAIARALAMLPLSHQLHIFTDSMASMKSIQSYQCQTNERKRLRASARPLLQLINHLMNRRTAAGGSLQLTHVPAHTTNNDLASIGNRIADYQANLSRRQPDDSTPLGLIELPIRECEHHLGVVRQSNDTPVIDDIRRTALKEVYDSAMTHWQTIKDQGRFAHAGTIDLARIILRFGPPSLQIELIQIATNSIHQQWQDDPLAPSGQSVQSIKCMSCDKDMSIDHLGVCDQPTATHFRDQLTQDIINILMTVASSKGQTLLTQCSLKGLEYLLLQLCPSTSSFPPPTSGIDDVTHHRRRHFIRCMIGAFTEAESNTITRNLDIKLPNETTRTAMRHIRMACLEGVGQFYISLKA
jgi:ribonuclease HI